MSFFHKTASPSSASSSCPSSPAVSNNATGGISGNSTNNRGQSLLQRGLTRQRKLRHVTDQELGLNLTTTDWSNSPPVSPDSARKPLSPPAGSDHYSPSALPQPLPLPELPFTRRNNNVDHAAAKSAKPSRRFFRKKDFESANYELRLRIPVRSAPSTSFSSPAVSPLRSNAKDVFIFSCATSNSTKCASHCRGALSHDSKAENDCCKFNPIDYARSAPTSALPSPTVSPPKSNVKDSLSSFVTPSQEIQGTKQRSLIHSLTLQGPQSHPKSPDRSPFPRRCKMLSGRSKEWHGFNNHASAHPLPLPPEAAAASQSVMLSPPAVPHAIERPILSSKKTQTQWQRGKLIGRGTYGSVYVGTNRETGALCAMKEVDIIPDDPKSAQCIQQLEQEIRVLRQLEHPNIVQYYDSEIIDDHFYIYMEYVHPGSISKYVQEHCGDMTESIVRNFTRHILSGLAYLHGTKTIHRDIKGANLLVDASGTVKLADFGMAKHLSGLSYELSLKGSPHWMAPEVIKSVMQKDASPDLALAVDIWSVGCTIIEMFTGKPPWGELHGPSAMFKVLNRDPPIPEKLSSEGKDFLRCCFRRNPADRPSATMLLEHPFLRHSYDLGAPAFRQALSVKDKPQSSKDSTAHRIDSPNSPGTKFMNCKQTSDSETSQQGYAKSPNCAAVSHRSLFSTLEVLPTTRSVHGSHDFSSPPNISTNVPFWCR